MDVFLQTGIQAYCRRNKHWACPEKPGHEGNGTCALDDRACSTDVQYGTQSVLPLHIRTENNCARVCFVIALHLALGIFLGTAPPDWFIRESFPSTRKFVPRNSQLVALVALKARNTEMNVHHSNIAEVRAAE